ncbi:hypothetical protein CIK97_10285 [Prevotella sp. P3-120]|uniref:DUF4421 domain-containing protein n=1 Tax=unclassified Prevotella TaxID=2638335 RepID=UPI000B976D90|nr:MULTISPECIES: DUF4421 domain-containing protein [unclassified Prevotella]OYP48500.1 hypothetical protein CIK97_10285 [Prevotella sp. P3-120]OYP51920.1 hypothetical protein CIK93_04265 [Prevotella sp. P3-92]
MMTVEYLRMVLIVLVLALATTMKGHATQVLPSVNYPVKAETDTQKVPTEVSVPPKRKLSWLRRTIRGFSYIDTNYVEPQHYNWAVMLQATQSYDIYQLRTSEKNGQSLTFSPNPTIKIGPYFGWRWVFLGYTFDVKHFGFNQEKAKQGWDFSIYAAQVGLDIFYRKTGSDYKISRVRLSDKSSEQLLKGHSFDGLKVGTTGFNLYYIFNHQRFSYPAAFAQSTCQKISCGSWMAGIGYSHNSLSFDHERLQDLIDKNEGMHGEQLDSALMFNKVKYYNYNASVGYAYNWVFAPNFLFCASTSLALAYKKTKGEMKEPAAHGFDINNVNIDGIGRFGLVFNNTRFFAGLSAIVYWNNYKKSRFSASNIYGTVNAYVGYNFGKRGRYKNRKQ